MIVTSGRGYLWPPFAVAIPDHTIKREYFAPMTSMIVCERRHGRRGGEAFLRQFASSLLLATFETAAFCICPPPGALLLGRLVVRARFRFDAKLIVPRILRHVSIRWHFGKESSSQSAPTRKLNTRWSWLARDEIRQSVETLRTCSKRPTLLVTDCANDCSATTGWSVRKRSAAESGSVVKAGECRDDSTE